jgi:hypothetical protein
MPYSSFLLQLASLHLIHAQNVLIWPLLLFLLQFRLWRILFSLVVPDWHRWHLRRYHTSRLLLIPSSSAVTGSAFYRLDVTSVTGSVCLMGASLSIRSEKVIIPSNECFSLPVLLQIWVLRRDSCVSKARLSDCVLDCKRSLSQYHSRSLEKKHFMARHLSAISVSVPDHDCSACTSRQVYLALWKHLCFQRLWRKAIHLLSLQGSGE